MPITKTITLYTFEELSDKAKEKARDWFRELESQDFSSMVSYDDFEEICRHMGVTLGQRPYQTMGGDTRYEPTVFWSGFSSQGDGACFEGTFSAADFREAGDIRNHAPVDEKLHAIHDEIAAIVAEYPELTAKVGQFYGSNYSHSHTMYLDEAETGKEENDGALPETTETALRDLLRRLADWFYRYLGEEYEYRMSDEAIDESITINEYTFREDGKRED